MLKFMVRKTILDIVKCNLIKHELLFFDLFYFSSDLSSKYLVDTLFNIREVKFPYTSLIDLYFRVFLYLKENCFFNFRFIIVLASISSSSIILDNPVHDIGYF